MSKKRDGCVGIPLESILLDLNSPKYSDQPYRASILRKELARMIGRRMLEEQPDRAEKPASITEADYLEQLAVPLMEGLQRAAYELYISDIGRRNINIRHSAPGGSREQRKKHREAYLAAYSAGECATHASFVERYANTPGFNVEARVLARHLKGLPSARKKQTHTP